MCRHRQINRDQQSIRLLTALLLGVPDLHQFPIAKVAQVCSVALGNNGIKVIVLLEWP